MVTVKGALAQLYIGKCTIVNQVETTDADTHQTSFSDVTVATDQPCRLSFSTVTSTQPKVGSSDLVQVIKLFLDPDIVVAPGSKITVTQNGKTTAYKSSGYPAIHTNHQEVVLTIDDDYS